MADEALNVLSKLTVKTLGCSPKLGATSDKPVAMCRIFGIANKVKLKIDQKGDTLAAVMGEFEGTNLQTGKVFRSNTLYLPGGGHDRLVDQIEAADGEAVQFAIEIASQKADNPAGYSFIWRWLLDTSKADPLQAMRQSLGTIKPAAEPPAVDAKAPETPKPAAPVVKGGKK